MKDTWATRLRDLLEGKGWSVAEYVRRVHAMFPNHPVGKDSIHKYLKGKVAQPRGDVLERLAAPFSKTAFYLQHGEDPPNTLKRSKIPLLTMNEVGTYEPTANSGKKWEGKFVPAEEDDVARDLVAVKLPDDSCAPEIKRGSTVFCTLVGDDIVEPGSLVVAKVHGLPEGVCRKYRSTDARDKRRFKLIAINPDYPDIEATPEKPVTVFGKVVRVLTNYP